MTDTTRDTSTTRDLPLEPGGGVEILLTSSNLRLRGVDGDRVTVRTGGGEDIDDEVQVEAAPGRIRVRDSENGFRIAGIRLRTHHAADLDIDVPRRAPLTIRTLSGDILAAGIGGASRWATASGDLRLELEGGPVAVESVSGDVTLSASVALAVTARSVSGDLVVSAPRLDRLTASTTSGDVRVQAALATGDGHEISSVSGDVELATPSPVRIVTQTITGDVRAFGTHVAEGGRGNRTLVVGGGDVRVSVRTTSGDFRLRAWTPAAGDPPGDTATPAPAGSPAPVEPPAEPPVIVVAEAEAAPNLVRPGAAAPADSREAARLEILRALEHGDLDIEAASHRLEALEEAGPRSFRGWS